MSELTNLLSIDVEEWFQVEAFANHIPKDRWESLERRARPAVERLLDLLATEGVRATFFVLGWVAERDPALVKAIVKGGHEIASHGWSHRALWHLDPASFREEAERSKRFLEDLSGKPVLGFRAPTFSITRNTMWGLEILAETGYQYDSSIFPIHHDRYGIPDSPLGIHKLKEGLWEIPMSVQSFGRFRLPVAGGGYFRLFPLTFTSRAVQRMNAAGRPAIVYIHPWEFDPDQPRWPGVPFSTEFRHHVGIRRNLKKLRTLLGRFRFGTAEEVLTKAKRPLPEGSSDNAEKHR